MPYLGYAADADLPSLYGNARAFPFPSLEDGFGLPLLEAMASGAPVLTSDRSTLREVVGDAASCARRASTGRTAPETARILVACHEARALGAEGGRRSAS